jgi:hypothetical protein
MASGLKTVKSEGSVAVGVAVRKELGVLSLIEAHRKTVLSTPFIFAAILIGLYMFAGNEFRQVLDFLSPGHIFGR